MVRFSTASTTSSAGARCGRVAGLAGRGPTIMRMISAGVVAATSERADGLAVAQHGDAVADAEDLVHLVRDVDDGDAALFQLARSGRRAAPRRRRTANWWARPSAGCARSC